MKNNTNENSRAKILPLLGLLTAFPPLSTDMYLPAIPTLQRIWDQPLVLINLTLIGFFLSYCSFLLLYGPLSDRYGRRGPLMTGVILYTISSFVCARAPNIYWMIVARVIQGAGGAAASALALAITKDLYSGKQRERIIAQISVIMALAPMLAPILGSWILSWLDWRWIFFAQAGIGIIAAAGVQRMPETLQSAVKSGPVGIGSYLRLVRNRRFFGLTLATSSLALPIFAFIAGSSDIYINRFTLSPEVFARFFAFNAVGMMAGPWMFSRLSLFMSSSRLMTFGFSGVLAGGLCMVVDPGTGPWHLALPNWLIAFSLGLSRPPSSNLVLEQIDRDAGAASSLMMFTNMMIGALGMWLISLDWTDKVSFIGCLGVLAGGVSLSFWLVNKRRLTN